MPGSYNCDARRSLAGGALDTPLGSERKAMLGSEHAYGFD